MCYIVGLVGRNINLYYCYESNIYLCMATNMHSL